MKYRMPLLVSAAMSAALLLCACSPSAPSPPGSQGGTSTASETSATTQAVTLPPDPLPSVAQASPPPDGASPRKVLECLVDCLQKGDTDTLCSLFVDSTPEDVYEKIRFAFYGPLQITDVTINVDDTRLSSEEAIDPSEPAYMYIAFWAESSDVRTFGGTEVYRMDIGRFPVLIYIDGQWKIQTMGGSSP